MTITLIKTNSNLIHAAATTPMVRNMKVEIFREDIHAKKGNLSTENKQLGIELEKVQNGLKLLKTEESLKKITEAYNDQKFAESTRQKIVEIFSDKLKTMDSITQEKIDNILKSDRMNNDEKIQSFQAISKDMESFFIKFDSKDQELLLKEIEKEIKISKDTELIKQLQEDHKQIGKDVNSLDKKLEINKNVLYIGAAGLVTAGVIRNNEDSDEDTSEDVNEEY